MNKLQTLENMYVFILHMYMEERVFLLKKNSLNTLAHIRILNLELVQTF
jgi:hypothetical protein